MRRTSMGWGLLFFGYFLVFVLGLNPLFEVFATIPGWAVMLVGLCNLKRYCHSFRYAQWCVYPTLFIVVWQTFVGIQTQFDVPFAFLHEQVTVVVGWAELLAVLLFHTVLVISTKELALRVSVPKNAVRAMRNLVLVWLYGILLLVQTLIPKAEITRTLYPVLLLLQLVWAISFCVLLYSCYMRICPADDIEHTRKPSRFAWINRLRVAMDEKEQRAIEADRTYHAKQARERQEKSLARLSQKQRAKQELKNKRNK